MNKKIIIDDKMQNGIVDITTDGDYPKKINDK